MIGVRNKISMAGIRDILVGRISDNIREKQLQAQQAPSDIPYYRATRGRRMAFTGLLIGTALLQVCAGWCIYNLITVSLIFY